MKMPELTFKHIENTLDDYDLLLFDLWGVVVEGDQTYPGVVEALNELIRKKRMVFLSNAPRAGFIVAENMRNWGVKDVTPEMVVTSGDVARQLIAESFGSGAIPKIYHLGSDRNDDLLVEMDHRPVTDITEADILLLSIYRDEHEDIHEFNDLLKQAASKPELLNICSNPDTTIPKRGVLRYCAGHFAGILKQFGSSVIYTGKPETSIYERVFQQNSDIAKSRMLMVGDTFETDILGANRFGIDSALVLTGNAEKFHKAHVSIEDKLQALSSQAKKVGTSPTFVTQIV
jgi:HAD superfamily hydrolase (TIGR01459 family)